MLYSIWLFHLLFLIIYPECLYIYVIYIIFAQIIIRRKNLTDVFYFYVKGVLTQDNFLKNLILLYLETENITVPELQYFESQRP